MIRWLLALSLGAAVAWMAYGRAGVSQRTHTGLLAALRALAVTLVAGLLLGAPAGRARGATALVALDASASWLRGAPGDTNVVHDALRTALREAGADSVMLAGDSLRDVSESDALTLVPTDRASSLRPTIDRATALGRPLVLVTDGEIDDASLATDLPAGSRIVVPVRTAKSDAAVAALESPFSATAGDTVAITTVIAAGGAGAGKGEVRLLLDGKLVGTTVAAPLTAFASRRMALSLPLPRGARKSIVQAVVVSEGDMEVRNDTLGFALEVGDRPAAVFISTAPDLDVREALSVLRGALDVPARAYLRLAPNLWREEGTLKAITEVEVRARAQEAGMVILHGDTAWGGVSSATRGARALWVPAPPAAAARAGEIGRAAEWYAMGAPPSPLASALAGLPWDTLPPISVSAPARGSFTVVEARLGKTGTPVPIVAGRETAGGRTLVITGSGFAGWSLRAGRSADAFIALWGAMFDWLSAARGDQRSARPVAAVVRAGEPVHWRRGGVDSIATVLVTRRAGATKSAGDSLTLHFASGNGEAISPPLAEGIYDVGAAGGASVLVVNSARELVPRAPTLHTGSPARALLASNGPRLTDYGWPFILALLLLCGEWLVRRYAGLR